jgi:ElaA protein
VSLGRIIAKKRLCGLGRRIVAEGIKAAGDFFKADTIVIGAQIQAGKFYEKQGFIQISEEFLEDDIPHIKMEFKMSDSHPLSCITRLLKGFVRI